MMSSPLTKVKEAIRKNPEVKPPKPLATGDFVPHIVLIIVLAAAGGASWWLGGYVLQNARQVIDGWRSDSWPSVQGTVVKSEIGSQIIGTRKGTGSEPRMLFASVKYSYEVKGKQYTNDRITYDVGFRSFCGKDGVWHDAKSRRRPLG